MATSNILTDLLLNPKFNKQLNWTRQYPEWYVYNVQSTDALASGATYTGSLTIQSDASFLVMSMNGTLKNANTQSSGYGSFQVIDASVNLFDSGSGKNLMSSPVQFGHLFGQNGDRTYDLPTPRFLAGNSTLTIAVTNNSGANITGIYMSFHGVKILSRK